MAETGKYIVFEGSDGSGKTTQLMRTEQALAERGHDVVKVFEPGASSIGKDIRRLLLAPESADIVPRAEVLLFTAERTQLWYEKIQPSLEEGKIVLSDRNWYSTWVYQGASDEALGDTTEQLVRLVLPDGYVQPDLSLYFDVSEASRKTRLDPILDKIESRDSEYFENVRGRYQSLPIRFGAVAIDGSGTPEEVQKKVLERVLKTIA